MKKLLILLLILGLYTNEIIAQKNSYSIIYEADKEGRTTFGSLEKLLDYVQNGNPIRVGWVLRFKTSEDGETIEMQHWADAGFVTTLNGHVFAQINSIFQQGPGLGNLPSVFLVNDKPHGWVSIIGTTGVMRQKYMRDETLIATMKENGLTKEQIEKQMKEMETMKVITKWAVLNR